MRTKVLSVASLFIVASVLLAACGGGTPQTVVQTVMVAGTPQLVEVTAAPPAGAKILHMSTSGAGDVPTVDPNIAEDTTSIEIVNITNIGLTYLREADATLHPGMAQTWDISADGLTYTFHLLPNIPWVRWNGTEVEKVQSCPDESGATKDRVVTAYDFEYGMKRALTPAIASPYAYVLAFAVQGASAYNNGKGPVEDVAVKAIDDVTLEVKFVEDAAYNINIIGLWTGHATPKWIIEGDDCTDARGDRWGEPGFFQGFGPFTLKEWVHDSYISVVKNPFWPGTPDIAVPKLDEIQFVMLDAVAQLAEYEAGNIDVSLVPSADTDRVKADPVLSKEYYNAPNLCSYYYGFNTKAKFVDDVRVRQALSMAIDRQGLIDNVLKAGQEPAQWFSRPGLVAAPTMADHPDLGIKSDPVAAKALLDAYLAEKGITAADMDLTLMFNTSSGHQRIAEAIQQMWKANLGLDVKVTNQEWAVYLATVKDPVATPQIWRMGWCPDYPDTNNYIREVFIFGGSSNPKEGGGINWGPGDSNYDDWEKLLLAAAKERDPQKRIEMYAQAEETLVKTEAAIIPIYWYVSSSVTKPYVIRTYSVTGHQDYTDWDLK
ncbi:MAG TPA: peptide ABC transporter substrate-binding protein [Anaerolineales bacterium]|nr:peptide ABC transporter substrate-binding protein [Anaerolineales bacterium]